MIYEGDVFELPCSFAQRRLWFLDRLEPGSAAYNVPAAIRLSGSLDVPALARSLNEVVARHEALRTTFAERDGEPVQVVRERARLDLPVVDLAGDREKTDALAFEEARRPFDLERGPLMRTTLLRLGPAEHVLVLIVHHIVADAWSMEVMVREAAAAYRGMELPELPIQYADFAAWQREQIQGETREALLAAWRRRLADAPPILELPTDRPRRPGMAAGGAWVELRASPVLADAVRSLAWERGATSYMVLAAAFAAVLARHTGQEDLVVGSPNASRGRPEIQGLIGFFVNPLPLRFDLSGDPDFDELVRRSREVLLDAYAHQDLPFEILVEELVQDRTRSPLFQVVLDLAGGPAAELELPGLSLRAEALDNGAAKFDLSLDLVESPAGLGGRWSYDTALFDGPTVARMRERFALLLAGAAASPGTRLSELPLLPEAERHQVLREWNDAEAADPGEGALFERLPASDAPALTQGDEHWTYRDLRDRAAALADELRRHEVRGQVVGLYGDRSPAWWAGALAILEAGAAWLPHDPAYPLERLRYALADARVSVVLADPDRIAEVQALDLDPAPAMLPLGPPGEAPGDRGETPGFTGEAPGLAGEAPGFAGEAPGRAGEVPGAGWEAPGSGWEAPGAFGEAPRRAGNPPGIAGIADIAGSDLAYVIYTSGSTGAPKGAMVEHRGMLNHLLAKVRLLGLSPVDVVAQSSSQSFDVSVWQAFAPLLAGARVEVVPDAVAHDPAALLETVSRAGITVLEVVPSLLAAILEQPAVSSTSLPSLRWMIATGEALPPELARRWLTAYPDIPLLNAYGPTECSDDVSHEVLRQPPEPDALRVAIGRTVDNLRLHVLGRRLELTPAGCLGELWVGGVGVGRGYVGDPRRTAESFRPDPFSPEPGGRMYRTGDLVRLAADGRLEFLGRIDQQVKVRGFRIEPGEIEAALAACPGVREAAVTVSDSRIVAWWTGGETDETELRRRLRETLPEPMVPARFVRLDALPLTPNGKVDRRELARRPLEPDEAAGTDAPRTPAEEVLAAVWAEVLGVERVGRRDDFFALGGHSLLATQAVSRVRAAFGVEIPVAAVFEAPTLAELAARIAAARGTGGPAAPPIRPVSRTGTLPLSFAQQRLWFLDRLVPDNPFYNMYTPLWLRGGLDVPALAAAFAALVRRHESLRTTFPAVGGEPVQAIAPAPASSPLPLIDLSGVPAEEAERLSRDEARRPFDLARGPLLRAVLLRLGPDRHLLGVNIHHIVSDGWSMAVLVEETAALYRAFSTGTAPRLPELPVQYADFAVWQREQLRGEALDAQLDAWRRRLAGSPAALDLPLDHPRPALERFRGGVEPLRWSAELVDAAAAVGRRRGATPAMTFLAGWKALLSRLSGQTDVLVGSAVANRNRREVEGLIGFFANTLVLRTDLSGEPGFGELIDRVREVSLQAYDHQDLPFERLVEELEPERSLARNPLVQVLFGFQNFPRAAALAPGLEVEAVRGRAADTGTSKFDLTLFLWQEGREVEGLLEHSSDLFDVSTVRRLLRHLETLIAAAAADPAAPVDTLPLLTPPERHQLLREWNECRSFRSGDTLHGRFAARVREAPDAVAVVCGDASLTYRDLDLRSAALARRLRAEGVRRGDRVGLRAERSVDLPAAILGILRAGAAYVPLDPAYPPERLAFLVEDSGVVAIVEDVGSQTEGPFEDAGDPEDVAYVIYTSGSTGRPKGVQVRHAEVIRLLDATDPWFGFGPDDVWTLFHSFAFDFSVWEIWGALLYGGRLVVVPHWVSRSPEDFYELLRRERVTVLNQTPSAFRQLARAEEPVLGLTGEGADLALRFVVFGGEALEPATLLPWFDRHGDERPLLVNMYGITETTVHVTWRPVRRAEAEAGRSVIGVPIPDLRLHVLDPRGEPAPIGVPGELHVGGAGLALGYLNRPELTAERFVPDPFGDEPGARLYRSGDLARRLADGDLEYLGRADHQIKVRGFRIEPGEIEGALARHPAVRESAVVVREDSAGDRRLTAYVVRRADLARDQDGEGGVEQVDHWQTVFDDVYSQEESQDAADADPTFNIVGWDSSLTGEPIPAAEMREWLEDTVGRILDLEPRRVLEIGCGTGMILFRVAPHCERYVATDLSTQALAGVERLLARRPERDRVELRLGPADRLEGIAPGFDTIILNSVVQYFPGADYLARVLEGAARLVRPGGAIFLGDLRSLPLLPSFYADVAAARSEPGISPDRLRRRVQALALEESELALASAYFAELRRRVPEIGSIEIVPRRGRADNELTRYRYQAVLRIGPPPPVPDLRWQGWEGEGWTLEALRRRLAEGGPGIVALRGIPNGRLTADGIHPQDVWDLSQDGWEAELGWGRHGADGRFDAVLRRRGTGSAGETPLSALLPEPAAPAVPRPLGAWATDPLQGWFARKIVPELRAFLAERLPEHMVPADFVVLDALPLTPHGKVDRRALPEPERAAGSADQAPPQTPTEVRMASLWEEVLDREGIGTTDSFFDLGGDSIKAVRLVARLNDEMDAGLQVRDVFLCQTVGALAARVDERSPAVSIEEERRAGLDEMAELDLPEDIYPLSSIEAGMVYYTLLLPDQPVYHDQAVYTLAIPDVDAFFHAFRLLAGRHPALRTGFHLHRFDRPVRVVRRSIPELEPVEDLSHLPEAERRARVEAFQAAELATRYTFDGEPLWRLKLFRLEADLYATVWSCHHAILDGWSNVSFWVEMNELCERSDLASLQALPPLASSYKDYVAITLGRRRSAATEDYWRRLLAGHHRNRLPFQRARTRAAEGIAAAGMESAQRQLGGELLDALRRRARELHVPLQAVFLAAHALLLHLTTGETDVVTGVVSNDRPALPDGDRILGCFLTTLPVRLAVDPRDTGASLIRKAAAYLRSVKAHELPLADVAALVGERTTAGNPIFDTIFNFLDFHLLEGVEVNRLFRAMASSSYSLKSNEMTNTLFDLDAMTTLGVLALKIKYSPRHFEPRDVETALDLYSSILEHVASDPAARLDAGALLPAADRERLVVEFNATQREFPRTPLHRLFEQRAAAAPEAPAIVCAGAAWSYGELNRRANRLARRLIGRGVRPGDSVGVVAERSPELVAALLAVLKAGAAYVPMEPDYPEARKAWIAERSRAVLVLEDPIEDPVEMEDADLPIEPGPRDLAYTIFTSGSTGQPKGVMIEHGSAVNLVSWVNREMAVGPGDRLLMVSSVCFDLSVYDLFGGLAAGATVVIARRDDLRDPDRLLRLVLDERITFWNSVPSTLGQLVRHVEESEPGAHGGHLRTVFLSGDWIPLGLPDRARAVFPNARVVSLGGATEATVWSNFFPVDAIDAVDPAWSSIPYGRPIENSSFYVLDRWMNPVAEGVVGDLYIGGVGLARGYAADPETTARSFVPNPFGEGRLYRTGDLGRMMDIGQLEFLGRADHQVKIRGFRVELGEIESQLQRHPLVRDAVVVDRADRTGEKALVAYVVADKDEKDGRDFKDVLRQHLATVLPEYMIPATFVFLEAIPLTPNGKPDRRALPAPEVEMLSMASVYVPPADGVERELVEIWQEVLGLDGIGVRHEFFELGGHSLSAVQVVSRIRRRFGADLPLPDFFAAPTVEAVAAALRRMAAADEDSLTGPRPQQPPLSFGQQRLWFLDRLRPGSVAYSMPMAVVLRGALDPAALDATLSEVVRRHEALRTRFAAGPDGEPYQEIAPPAPVPVPELDLSGLPAETARQEARRLAEEDARQPFDLTHGPLVRFRRLRMAGETRLLVNLHHAVSDGWSVAVLVREVAAIYPIYPVLREGRPSPLPELPVQYADYAVWQRRQSFDASLAWWKERLAGDLPVPDLAGDPGAGGPPRGRLVLDPDLLAAAHRAGRQGGATLFMVLLAAFQALLHRLSGEDDVIVGSPVAGRDRPELEGLIGLFLNNLALRTDLAGRPSFAALLGRVREATLAAYGHREIPFERIVEEVQPRRDLDRNPVFDVLFNLLNAPWEELVLPGLTLSYEPPVEPEAKFSLMVTASERQDGLELEALADRARFGGADVARLLGQLAALLRGVLENPELSVGAHPLLTPACLAVLPDPLAPLSSPRFAPVTALLAEWAERTPDAVAVTQGDARLTYRELASAAAGLAWRLKAEGLERCEPVAVEGARSPGLIAMICGVLAAGGLLVLLDPDLPEPRLHQMVAQTGARRRVSVADVLPSGAFDGFPPEPDPEDIAYVFFTSGSTGMPKGVVGKHAGLSHFVAWERERYDVGPGVRCAQLAAPAVDVILRESFLALTAGATLCLPDPGPATATPEGLLAWCARERVAMVHTVPTLAGAWLGAAPEGLELPDLRWLFLVGEPLPAELVVRWRRRFPGVRIVNLYGATETNLAKSFYEVPEPPAPGSQPAGRPLPDSQLLVLGPEGGLCAVGELGEIVVRTPFLALGYLGLPEETAARFAPGLAGDRVYRTGDLGRYRADGTVQVLGRADHQLKIRGVRVEPDEISAVLAGHPAVESCAVLALEGPRLVAAAVLREPADLLSYLAGRLPAVMVPSAVVPLERLPRTATGKLDRRALAEELRHAEGSAAGTVPPRTPVEELLAGIWSEALGVERVGVHDNFFALGGHSLRAAQVASRVHRTFGVEVPLRRLFEAPTVAALAAAVEAASGRPAEPIRPRIRRDLAPLSFAQERLWLLSEIDPQSPAYNIPAALRLRGGVDLRALSAAFSELVRRHEVLRATVRKEGGSPIQRFAPARPFPLPVVDLGALPDREREAFRLATDLARRPFDLAAGPLHRIAVLRLDADDHLLSLTLHHLVSDGWSRGVLVREIEALYGAFARRLPSPLPEPALQYADYAAWERERLDEDRLDDLARSWRELLAGAPPATDLPADGARRGRGAHHRSRLGREAAAAVSALALRRGATPFMVLLGALDLLLWLWCGEEDLVVGTVVAHRDRPELENLLGCFINFLPVRLRIDPRGTAAGLLDSVRSAVLSAWALQDCPFERLVQAVRPDRGAASPLYNVGFLLQNFPRPRGFGEGVEAEVLPVDTGSALLDLRLVALESDEGIDLWWEYDAGLFEPATVARLSEAYAALLARLVESPDQPLDAFDLPAGLQPRPHVTVESTFPAEPLLRPLSFWIERLGLRTQVSLGPNARRGPRILLARTGDLGGLETTKAPDTVILCPSKDPEEEVRVAAGLRSRGAHVTTSRELAELYPVPEPFGPDGAYTATFFAALATLLARRIHALERPARKAVLVRESALNGDGTLARFLDRRQEEGLTVVTWRTGAALDAVRALDVPAADLIFLDADPAACAEVQAGFPGALALRLPADPAEIPRFLLHAWAFDR